MHARQTPWALLAIIAALHLGGCSDGADTKGAPPGAGGAGGDDTSAGSGGDQGGAGGEGGASPGTLAALADAWCPVYADRYCGAATVCGCDGVPGFADAAGSCLDRAERGCRAQVDGYAPGVDSGALVPASEVPEGCAAALEQALAGCQMPPSEIFIVQCPLVWPRDAASKLPGPGESCADGLCAEGARCNGSGQCAAPSAGAACDVDGDCLAAERCGPAGRCLSPDFDEPRIACAGPDACGGDLQCLASARRECQPQQSGAACSDDLACVATEFCGDDGRCAPEPSAGEACGAGAACAEGLGCAMSPPDEGTCQPLPALGEPCAGGRSGPFLCSAGLACRDGVCGQPPEANERCAVGEVVCADGLGCHVEGAESLCKPRVGAGAPCGLDDSCGAGLFCDFQQGECAAFYAEGSACSGGNECGPEGACVPDAEAAFRCVPRPGLGGACFLDSCADGLYCGTPYEAGLCAPPMCAAFGF